MANEDDSAESSLTPGDMAEDTILHDRMTIDGQQLLLLTARPELLSNSPSASLGNSFSDNRKVNSGKMIGR